jgi:2-polyprenyl-3-methyl-5-hydroxy-6-metoxy-1,4-benzoquinol methylase
VSTHREAGVVTREANAGIYDVLAEAVSHRYSPRALDPGAGDLTVTLPFIEAGAEVTPVDVSERQLEVLRSRCGPDAERLSIHCGEVEAVICALFEAGIAYEVIVANCILHHVPDPAGLALVSFLPSSPSAGGETVASTIAPPGAVETSGACEEVVRRSEGATP